MPELTNPTTMTVVAEEDCIRAVTTSPSREALELIGSQFTENGLHLVAGEALQRVAHDVHSEKEQSKSAQKLEYFVNTHIGVSSFVIECVGKLRPLSARSAGGKRRDSLGRDHQGFLNTPPPSHAERQIPDPRGGGLRHRRAAAAHRERTRRIFQRQAVPRSAPVPRSRCLV